MIERATKYRAAVTALMFVGAGACWVFGVELRGSGLALMGALFTVTTMLMHERRFF